MRITKQLLAPAIGYGYTEGFCKFLNSNLKLWRLNIVEVYFSGRHKKLISEHL